MAQQILLLGLPGAGRRRFKQLFEASVTDTDEEVDLILSAEEIQSQQLRVWCLLDIRSKLPQEENLNQYLDELLKHSSGVIFNFMEASDLSMQMYWQSWLKKHFPGIPVMRLFHQTFPRDWNWQDFGETVDAKPIYENFPSLVMETQIYQVGTLNLEHLLMGLDAARNNLQMEIYRVQAKVKTFEYDNPVAIELTPNRVDTYAADQVEGVLKIQGKTLDKDWLEQLVAACQQ